MYVELILSDVAESRFNLTPFLFLLLSSIYQLSCVGTEGSKWSVKELHGLLLIERNYIFVLGCNIHREVFRIKWKPTPNCDVSGIWGFVSCAVWSLLRWRRSECKVRDTLVHCAVWSSPWWRRRDLNVRINKLIDHPLSLNSQLDSDLRTQTTELVPPYLRYLVAAMPAKLSWVE